jgi:uncharacterized protein YkwD
LLPCDATKPPGPGRANWRDVIDRSDPLRATRSIARRLTSLLVAGLIATTLAGGLPQPAAAVTSPDSMAAMVVTWLNRDRAAMGLAPVRTWGSLDQLATERATNLATSGVLSHQVAGSNIGTTLTARGLQWYGFGEIIGWTGWPWGSSEAARSLYLAWKGSPSHHDIMFSAHYNYLGVGFAHRAANNTTWSSIVFAESVDHTAPSARNGAIRRSGTTVTFAWSGYDPRLQTHTAGLRSFDLQYRIDAGPWRVIRDNTTATSVSLPGRPHGHSYSFRVQAADRRGNLSRWTSEIRIWVP